MYQATRLCLLLLLTVVGLSTGCTTFGDWGKAKDYVEWPLSRFAKDYQKPQRIAVIWSPDVMTVPGKPAMRGFGGRLYFYNEKSVAVPVKGELMIYGYEEPAPNVGGAALHPSEKKNVPDKKYKFSPEQFAERFSKSDLGASYSIWIPWDEAGGNVKRVSLIPIFKLDDEQVVYGDPAELTLPGRTPQAVLTRSQTSPAINSGSSNYNGANQSVQTTIPMPTTQQAMIQIPNGASAGVNSISPQASVNSYPQTIYPAGPPINVAPGLAPAQGNLLINGISPANYNTEVSYPGAVNQAAFQARASSVNTQFGSVPSSGLKTTTIQLPPAVGNRLQNQGNVAIPVNTSNSGASFSTMTPAAQTMMQMQAAGIDPQTQNAVLSQQGGVAPQTMGNQQFANAQYGNAQLSTLQHGNSALNQPISNVAPSSAGYDNAATSSPQLQQLPADFGPRKRQARVR